MIDLGMLVQAGEGKSIQQYKSILGNIFLNKQQDI